MKPEIVLGDLLESDAQYICHQCNCISKDAAGLAYTLFNRFPYANIYKDRTVSDVPGTIKIRGNGEDQRYIINMLAQFYPGRIGYEKDSKESRETYFKSCLDQISQLDNLKSIAFPWLIGCGIAGGDWEHYYKMIFDFANKIEAKVYIYEIGQ